MGTSIYHVPVEDLPRVQAPEVVVPLALLPSEAVVSLRRVRQLAAWIASGRATSADREDWTIDLARLSALASRQGARDSEIEACIRAGFRDA